MRRIIALLVLTVLGASTPLLAFDKPPFPRLAASWIGTQEYQDPNVQAQLAHNNVIQISIWPGWEAGRGMSIEQAMQGIKARNPNILIFNYINNNEILATGSAGAGEVLQKLQSQNWFLYTNGGYGNIVKSPWGNGAFYETNTTLFTPPDSNGDRWVEWYAKWAAAKMGAPNPSIDGFVTDNLFWKPRVEGDWNRDGTQDSSGDATVQTWYRQGYQRHFQVLNQVMPGRFQLGNFALDPSINAPEYLNMMNGASMEGMIGYSWSTETWGGWQTMMDTYRNTMRYLAEPKLGLFAHAGDPHDYRSMRYGLTSCLMDDGYYQFSVMYGDQSAGNSDSVWFDEYGAKLGYATSGPATASWQSGVYRRDFQNGIALVNPKGNGARQVFLEDDFVKLSGSQDPNVNNGQVVRSVILQDRDGIILMRRSASTAPVVNSTPTPVSSSSSSSAPAPVVSSSSSSSSSSANPSSSTTAVKKVPAPPSAVTVR